jgi:hypothetical protein
MVCKKNTNNLYWFGSKKCPTSSEEESLVLSCTEILVVGGYKLVRDGGAPRSQDV